MSFISSARQLLGIQERVGTRLLTATDGRDVLRNAPDGWEVEQPWLWWTGPANGSGSGGPFGNPLPGSGGPWMNWAALPSVARATSLIVDTLAGLPWHVLRGTEKLPVPDWIADPQALRIDGRVIDPGAVADARWSRMDFWAQWLTSALWFGDGYLYVPQRDTYGQPKPPLYVLHPHDVELDAGTYYVAEQRMDPLQIIHLRGLEPITGGHGSGVFDRFAAALGYSISLKDYAAGVFHAGVPAGYLKVQKDGMSQEKADELKAKWLAAHGQGQRSIAVLNSVTEFHPLTFTPVDAELIAAMQADINDLANAFGVPAYMLGGSTDSNTYANIESRRRDLVTFTHLPWATRIEAVLDAQLPRGTSLKVALDAMARADTKTRWETYEIALRTKAMTIDEVRELEDLEPLGYQPAALTPELEQPAPPAPLPFARETEGAAA